MKISLSFLLTVHSLFIKDGKRVKMEIFFTSLIDLNRINLTRNINSNDIISHGKSFTPDGQKLFLPRKEMEIEIFI